MPRVADQDCDADGSELELTVGDGDNAVAITTSWTQDLNQAADGRSGVAGGWWRAGGGGRAVVGGDTRVAASVVAVFVRCVVAVPGASGAVAG